MTSPTNLPDGTVLFGAAYYPEYFPAERRERDLGLMRDAHVTVIRVGESVWSTWEPSDGVFDTEWLRPTLDEAHRLGIRVVLGTPTYAIPPWMQAAHPELAAQSATGRPVPWGGRQEVDFTSPVFLRYAERMIRAVLEAYADHPAVIGFQVDNEPGLYLFHNEPVFRRFVDELRAEYGTVDALNEAWGLVYWSHRLAGFDELWRPDGNTLPQYDLAWRRFQTRLTTEFIAWQADIVREYSSAAQFVTTCLAYSRPTLDDVSMIRTLDVNSVNLYYGMQDHLDLSLDLPRIAPWTSTGVWGLLQAADRSFGTAQKRYLVTETNAQAIGASDQNYPPYPGQLRQSALALVSRGAAMIEYWHWNTIPYGTETFWGGVLPHNGEPGRVYAEVQQLGADLDVLGPHTEGYRPDHDVTFLYSNASRWAFDFFPPIPGAPSREHGGAYGVIFAAFYRGAIASGAQAAIVNDTQLADFTIERLVAEHPVLVVPALYVSTDATLGILREYARAGGHLVLGMRTGYADEQARSRTERQPGGLADDAAVWYEESSNLVEAVPLLSEGLPPEGGIALSDDARATLWADGLLVEGAQIVAEYDHHALGRFAALTTQQTGSGRISYVGTIPNVALAADLIGWAAPSRVSAGWQTEGASVTLHSGTNAGGDRLWFVHNWSAAAASVVLPRRMVEVAPERRGEAGSVVELAAWGCRVFREEAVVARR
ncbi:beta-galactosidase [Compostimonas suwonensis]|uniref:beta-galactosidase n=1 Tax=Compostimonas suwonensis TaxID=1048394 RepID=A0A2M9C577_9MICO|nr:beta-galactosidase [Compostimonas suwonensis]PJJ65627.1 beta-galactosidase [Compostimonas suwonensis]